MALVLKDRVRETSTTTGTGTFTLAGAVAGFQSFSAIGTGNSTYYTIVSTSDWEVGIGTWTSPDQLSRDTVLASTNAGALVTFSSGTKDVFLTFPAEGFAVPPAIGGTTPNTITGTTVSATTLMTLPTVTSGNVGVGVLQMVDGGDGYDYLNIYSDDVGFSYQVKFPYGADITGALTITGAYTGQSALFVGIGTGSGNINLRDATYGNDITVQAPASLIGAYTLTLPTSAGSNNQVLKTDGSGNLSWTDKFILGAGTATAGTAPLKFTSGTNLTTAEAGAMEYDGKVPYFSGAASQRGVMLAPQFITQTANYTTPIGTANTLKQLFNSTTNGALTVAANTTYLFECMINISSMSATAGTLQFGLNGTATYSSVLYTAIANKTALTVQTASSHTMGTVATAVVITASNTTTTGYAFITGKIVIGTGGTIVPSFALSIAAAAVVNTGSYFVLTPIGSNTVTNVGNWS